MLKNRLVWLAFASSLVACNAPQSEQKRLEDVDFTALSQPCECLEAAVVMYDHTIDLVLKIKSLSDETRKNNNLGQATPEAQLDSLLMLSEQLRADLDGPGMALHRTCKDLVDLDAVAAGTESIDCPNVAAFQATHARLNALKTGAER